MVQPAEPEGLDREGLLRGMYLYSEGSTDGLPKGTSCPAPRVRSGDAVGARGAGAARNDWNVAPTCGRSRRGTSCGATGWCEQAAFLDPEAEAPVPWVTQKLADRQGPVVAVSDYMRAVQDQIRQWVPATSPPSARTGSGSRTLAPLPVASFHIDGPLHGGTGAAVARPGAARSRAPCLVEAARRYRLSDVTAGALGNEGGDS